MARPSREAGTSLSSSLTPAAQSNGPQWTKLLGVAGAQTRGYGIAMDSSANSYVTGYTYGNLTGQTLAGTRDVFVTALPPPPPTAAPTAAASSFGVYDAAVVAICAGAVILAMAAVVLCAWPPGGMQKAKEGQEEES